MIPAIKAECRKLLTIRSTYIIVAIAYVIVIFFSFYVDGIKGADVPLASDRLLGSIMTAASFLPIFAALVAILLIGHEYRYNTIMYSLTSVNRRSKVLIAKITALTGFSVLFMVGGVLLSMLALYVGLAIKDVSLVAQYIDWGDITWRILFYGWAYTMIGLLIGLLLRSLVGAIAVIFLVPTTVETLLALVLKDNASYLPFRAIEQVIVQNGAFSAEKAAGIVCLYLAGVGAITWLLFLRRDAN